MPAAFDDRIKKLDNTYGAVIHNVGRIRWLIVFLLFLVAAVSYLDRSNISIAAPVMMLDMGLTNRELGFVFSAFAFGYALSQPIAGRLADKYGPLLVIAAGIIWWSVLTFATALISSTMFGAFGVLLAARFMLGVGESIIFPASNRLIAGWIPSHERGLANGLIFAGVGFGAGVAPPLITTVMLAYDWRMAFYITAVIGLVVLGIWIILVRNTPKGHFLVKQPELAYINAGLAMSTADAAAGLASWGTIVRTKTVALLTAAYFCFGYVAYIFFTWFFTYLSTVRGLDLKSSGYYAVLPFIAMAVASPCGGYISDRLVPRYGRRIGRCGPAAVGMALAAMFIGLATQVDDVRLAAAVLALGSGSLYLSQSAFWALSADIGGKSAGSVSGVMNMGNQFGGVGVAIVTPFIAETFGWSSSFIAAATAGLIGAVLWLMIDPDSQLQIGTEPD